MHVIYYVIIPPSSHVLSVTAVKVFENTTHGLDLFPRSFPFVIRRLDPHVDISIELSFRISKIFDVTEKRVSGTPSSQGIGSTSPLVIIASAAGSASDSCGEGSEV